jgi:hypothetical protein
VGILLGALLAAAIAAPPAYGAEMFEVGAARVDITPPPPGPDDPAAFALCAPVFDGARMFAFNEPYTDVSGNGRFEYGEPYCDANANGRYDGIYSSGAVDSLVGRVHDPIDVRAVAIGDGSTTVVYASVAAQGLFENYTRAMRDQAVAASAGARHKAIEDVVVSANHNESSPDTVGLYGGPETPAGVGGNSGIDDYYMDWLEGRVADAAVRAADAAEPATLHARQYRLPAGLRVALSHNFPTTYDDRSPAAIDPKVGLLQARRADGSRIVTVMSLAAHNQEVGHSAGGKADISSDWPGYFSARAESKLGGMAMFLVGDNGSEEDPITEPSLAESDDPYPQAQATGEALAEALVAEAPRAQQLRYGPVGIRRADFMVPLENNAFKAAAAAGLFGTRPTYTAGQESGRAGSDLLTGVSVGSAGPDLQLIGNPAESFPGLILGTPFGIEDAPCPSRANPPVPTWRGTAAYRLQVGLADDLIGYLSPPWAFTDVPGIYTAPPECQNDPDTNKDSKGHQHKLETESVGPTAGGLVAQNLTDVLKAGGADPSAEYRLGRFVHPDGSVNRKPDGAVAIWLAKAGTTALAPGTGTIVALPGVTGFGSRAIDASGRAMDYDGAEQPAEGDVATRGMLIYSCDGSVARRVYLDLYPALSGAAGLGSATRGEVQVGCGAGFGGGPGNGPGGAGGGPPQPVPGRAAPCVDRRKPFGRFTRSRTHVTRRRVSARGRAADRGCAGLGAVLVSMSKPRAHRCRFVRTNGRLTRRRSCSRPVLLRATGRRAWRLTLRTRLPRGSYRMQVRAVDRLGNKGRPGRRAVIRVRVR